MPSLQNIRRKTASVKNTQKITKAMKMVAAAKLKRAQERILAARPYAQSMETVLGSLSARVSRDRYPLLKQREVKRVELVVVTADRGLCGGFNANILRAAQSFIRVQQDRGRSVGLSLIGRKSRDFFQRRNIPHRRLWMQVTDRLDYAQAAEIGHDLIQAYLEGAFDELYLLYNEFHSVMSQRVTTTKLLPVPPSDGAGTSMGEYLFEPSEEELLEALLPRFIQVQVFRSLLESAAGELGARMTAMDSASRNAKEVIGKLTLLFNKTRQAAITKELMDIVGGAEALKGG
jgi:F-type H+-transporting ATPase subunit gamma